MTTREIVLDGGSPWGFRMHGGADVGQPLRISRVNPGSKAAQKGIREGDVISSINGQPTRGISNSDAHALLRNAGQTLHLGLNEECGGSPKRRAHRSSQQQQEVTKHSSQQSTSRFPGSVNGVTDQNYNTVTSRGDRRVSHRRRGYLSKQYGRKKRGDRVADLLRVVRSIRWRPPHVVLSPTRKDDASTEGVSSSESKGKRRQKQSAAATQHSLAPPLQEESPGSSAVSSDVKEEPAASSSKSKRRKRNRKKNRGQQKNASSAAVNGKVSDTASANVSDVVQQTSVRELEEVDTSQALEPSVDGSVSQPSIVVQQTSSREAEETKTSPSKDITLGNISESSAVSETNTVHNNDTDNPEQSESVTEGLPASTETEYSRNVEELDVQKSSSPTASSSKHIKENGWSLSQQTSSTVQSESIVSRSSIVSANVKVHPEAQLSSVNDVKTITQTDLSSHQVNAHSQTEQHHIFCEEKESKSNFVDQEVVSQDNVSTGPEQIIEGAAAMVNTHSAVSPHEEANAEVEPRNPVQHGQENSRESPKRDCEVALLSNAAARQGDSETAVQVNSCQSSVECRAVVVETVDEEVWEEAVEFSVEGIHDPGAESSPLTSNTVSLQQYDLTLEDEELLDPKPLIAAQEEETLRNFLYSLNLADYGRDSPRRGKRRSSQELACNSLRHQRSLEVIMEENSSEISDSGDSKRGKGWKDAIYIPGTNEVVYLNEDSADEGEYTTEEASSKTENATRSLYYAETTTTLTTGGTSSAEMREFIYRTVGERAKDDEDVFSAHMERTLEADAENGPQIVELVSEGEDEKEDVVTTQTTEEKQSGVEVVFVEDDTTSTSSGAPGNWEDVEDAPYEDVMFPVQGQPKYTHRREDSIYENMEIDYGRGLVAEDDTVYENVNFTKRDAQEHVSFSTSSSEPRVSSRHLTCLVPPSVEGSCRSELGVPSVPLEQEASEGETLGQVLQESAACEAVTEVSNCVVPEIIVGELVDDTLEPKLSSPSENRLASPTLSGRDISDSNKDAVEDGRDSVTPTNNLSRRGSTSSDDTASHGTAFYCPVDAHSPALSSDADISSLTEEVPEARRKKVQPTQRNAKSPLSLKELCVARVVTMPYGTYILNILGVRPHATPVRESPRLPEEHAPDEQWLATPTSDDPSLLVCLSPSQRKVYNEEVPSPDEMQSLLDLHCKFLQRRGYHEKPPPLPPSRKYRPLTSPRGDTKISPTSRNSSSRLLAILREEKVKPPPLPPPPDMSSCCKTAPPTERLKVRSLSDWLQLVRCAGGEANENTNGTRSKDSTPPILSTQSSPGTVRRSSHPSANHLVRCSSVGVSEKGKDSTPPLLSTQSSPGTVRRSVPGQQLPWYVGCSASETGNDPTSPILSTQSSPGGLRRSVPIRPSFPGQEEEQLPQVPVRTQENRRFDADNYRISKRGDIAIINTSKPQQEDRSLRPRSLPPPSEALVTGGEIFRQQMYLEYMRKVAERSERRRQRVIRLSSVPREDDMTTADSAGGPLENEFMDKVRERMDKLGIRYDEEDGGDSRQNGVGELPKHLQEFLALTDTPEDATGVWSPSQKSSSEQDQAVQQKEKVGEGADDAPPVVWTPKSAGASPTTERKEFRPIKFESPTLSRKNRSGTSTPAPKTSDGSCSEVDSASTTTTAAATTTTTTTFSSTFQPWQTRDDSTLINSDQRVISSSSSTSTTTDRRLVQSQSAPASGLSSLAAGTANTKLPRAQNPTITLLQKAREGQLPKGALYLDHRMNSKEGENAYISPNEILYNVKKEYESEVQNSQRKKIVELTPRKFEGIGPTTEEGIPTVLRSKNGSDLEVKDANQAKWYKRMYDSLHRAGKDDDYITIRYKTRKGQYPYTSPGGYLSEPEPACYDSDIGFSAKYATLDRRRIKNKENDFTTSTLPRSRYVPHPSSIKYATQVYKNQPGRIEDYEPGRSSISEKETKQWWDEVLDIFDGWLESYSPHHPTYRSSSQLTTKADAITTAMYQQRASAEQQTNQSTSSNKTFMAHALKDGYESDSTLVFKRRDENLQSQLSPAEQKQAYKTIQKGGEVPLHGLRKPAPERPKDISELEYFPISAHLTRIRVHKQHVTPLREIVCYPVTASYNNNAVPPVFSAYKRTAPSYSQVQQTRKPPPLPLPPPPPSPPKRLSSHHSSALRLWSHAPRHRHEACFSRDTNISFLRDRLSHKLGVKLRTTSSSPVASKIKAAPRSRSAPEERQLGRRKPGHQEAWLNQAPDLSSPHEVRKALQRQKDVRERPGTKGLPPGTIIRSSTTPYASVRNSPHLPEDKALKVTVAISPKGRELLRPRAHASLSSLKTSSKSGTPSPEGTRSPSISSPVAQTSGRTKTVSSRNPSVSSSSGKKSTKPTTLTEPSRVTKTSTLLLAQDAGNRRVQKTNNKKTVKDKTPLAAAKTSASSKVCSKAKEEKETSKRKTKKVKTDGESSVDAKRPSGAKVSSNPSATKGKANSTDKKKGQVAEKKAPSVSEQQNLAPVSQQQGPLHTDSFFQHLLLRDMPSPTPSMTSSLYRSSGVLDKVQKFHELVTARSRACHRTDASLGLLNVYLAQKKPVTESKFRSLEREHSRSPSPSYRSIRTRFSELSSKHNTEDGAFYSFCPSRSRTPEVAGTHSLKLRSCSEPPPGSVKSEASEPAAARREKPPISHRCHSPVSPASSRSPSYRRIRSVHCHGAKTIESIAGVKRKGPRAHSAGEAEARLKKEDQPLARSVSSLNIADHAEYQTYVMELVHSTKKSERFRELHNFYASLERLGQLEKTTSTGDLRPRLKGEEVIDYDRWKRLRTKERAEEELKVLYRKLKEAQKEKDLLFQPKDVESVRWRGDRGLRCKDKSVEDLREQFGKLCREDSDVATKRKELDVYKPLWRGSSVLNLVSNLSSTTASRRGRPVTAKEHYGVSKSLNRPPPGRYGRGIGCRLWSSLSMDQVNALKTQLNEIYSSVQGVKKEPDEFEITVDDKVKKDTLHVRCNSLLTRDQLYSPMVRRRETRRIESMKADSISAMHHGDEAKPLSETEKKRLSLTLSQEVLDRVTKKHKRVSSPRETLGAIAAAAAAPKSKPKSASPVLSETASPRTCYSLEMSEEDGGSSATRKNDFLLVLTPSNGSQSQQKEVEKVVEEWANSRRASSNAFTAKPAVTTSASETESASSDASTRTVIHREDVSQKEDKTTRVSRSASDIRPAHQELTSSSRAKSAPGAIAAPPARPSSKLHSSQSFADMKEIFGEQSRLRYLSESPTRRCYSSPDSGRSGSLSPDTTGCRSWRSYLKMVKSGDVKRLKEKFESLEELCEEQRRLRKHKSDPELTRQRQVVVRRQEIGDVRWLRRRYETTCCRGRRRTRVSSPVLRHPIRLEDRFMPHINVISKTASLQQQQQSRSVTPTSLPDDGYHTGEVQKLRRKFECLPQLSLMGQMFTSTPDVRELRDIAPYLECHWVAHRFPDPGGGSPRSLSSPELRPAPPTPARPRPSSSSPCTRSQPSSSILKQQQQRTKDIFANQSFDPSKHRPVYRYQPADVDWQRSRPTVTFKESPHRYVESEVTIHYRSPVRSEAKEVLSEEELARRQAEAMRRIYQEERRRKYLQELQDMHSRRHTDNFTPSQKSPIPLNRYDDFFDDVGNKSKSRDRTPEPKLVARALYNFVGQTSRELSFRRGDIIFVRRQIDKNWYEGEHNAMVGLFPFNYVEIIPYDGIRTMPKRPTEGQARAKFNFIAQTHLELSLVKGELVVLTRRVDDNWFEGRIGNRKGIFPVSYVEVLQEPGEKPVTSTAPPSKPASHTTLVNGTGIKQSMGSHSYQPSFYYSHNKTSSPYTSTNPYATLPRQSQLSKQSLAPVNQTLHIDTHSEPVPYRALYNYRPQNEDELELCEGDTVYVMEKCDDGWYVGSSQRTGYFGTFPGNYVERI